ncbi:MAG: trigger factor [Clostridia bacterium]|nr:trigger factor [Clostridia bacterium]
MNLVKSEKNEHSMQYLEFAIDKATFDAAVDKVYRKQVKNINVPGFRKGKAPKSVIEKMYGAGVFFEDAINDLIPENYEAAVKEAGIVVVGQPEIDVVSLDENGLVLSAKVPVKPEMQIKDYKGIEAVKAAAEATDEQVDRELEMIRERNSREIEITEEAAQMGDIVKIDFDGSVDGVAFDGGKGTDYSLKLGSGSFIPGFEEQIAGHTIGEEFDVNVTFPEDYHAAELAGKASVFKTKVNAISRIELPELDDEFAKDASEFDTLDELKADMKAKIQERNEKQAENEFEEKLIEALIEKLEGEIPEAMFVNETENFVRDFDNRLRSQGMDMNLYFKYTGLTIEALREQMRPQAERQVKARLALETIAALEGVVASEDEINAEYQRIADAYRLELEQVKSMLDDASIIADLQVKKAMDIVKEAAVIKAE